MMFQSFKQWRESSPSTRNKQAAANGLQPMYSADVFGHSTPPPHIADKLLKLLKKSKEKKEKHPLDEESLDEKVMTPNYQIDDFIKRAKKVSDQIADDLDKGQKKVKDLESKKKQKEKEAKKKKPEAPQNKMLDKPQFPPQVAPTTNREEDLTDDDNKDDLVKQNEMYQWEHLL